ncbi:MAG: hypothetical protein PHO58_05030 [Bacilli bacterium]|nr:hypothetical protein [Bacilli bacterium]
MNIKAELNKLPLKKMNGQQKFVAVAYFIYLDNKRAQLDTSIIKKNWVKSILKNKYNKGYYDRAQKDGLVDPHSSKKGCFTISEAGIKFMESFNEDTDGKQIRKTGKLIIVNKDATYSFDKFLRNKLSKAKSSVLIVDPYFEEVLFDRILGIIDKNIVIKIIHSNENNTIKDNAKRFSREYKKFQHKINKNIHDRFLIIDNNNGFILGPSIKDAADKNPALIVALEQKETHLLKTFFDDLWQIAK